MKRVRLVAQDCPSSPGGGRPRGANADVRLTVAMRRSRTRFELALVHYRVRSSLQSPALSPASIAAECGMSLRKLHGLFAASDDTFSSYVRRSRLELAHAFFSDGNNWATITEVAESLGFKSVATFYRAYGEAFGEAPGDTRRAALSRLEDH